jgi:hypothetical protein
MRRAVAAGLVVLAGAGAAGCQSTQEKSAKLAAQAGKLEAEEGLKVGERSRDVTVAGSTVITDENGSAVVVRLDNEAGRTLADVPIGVALLDAAGETVFRNDTPGLQRSLTHAALLERGRTVWVNDQVVAASPPERAQITVGASDARPPDPLPRLSTSGVRLIEDPVSGVAAAGSVRNDGAKDLRRVLVTAVAERGGKAVAAGRAIVPRVRAGKGTRFRIFFIGDPKGAELTATAQPSEAA